MSGSWLKETFEKGVDELQKLARTGSIKIDIANLKKKRDERVKVIGNKVLAMIKRGDLKADVFEPDYSYVLDMDSKIEKKEAELTDHEPEETAAQAPAAQTDVQEEEPEAPIDIEQPPAQRQADEEEEEHDPHEDYINRPG